MANAIQTSGGARRYEEELWKAFAFIARYGHQKLEDVLDLDRFDREIFMTALAGLIKQENSPNAAG